MYHIKIQNTIKMYHELIRMIVKLSYTKLNASFFEYV